jgi:hypothetical protein
MLLRGISVRSFPRKRESRLGTRLRGDKRIMANQPYSRISPRLMLTPRLASTVFDRPLEKICTV